MEHGGINRLPELNRVQKGQVRALVNGEVQNVLREMRDAFYLSGAASDYRIAERLDYLITARERNASECDHAYPEIGDRPPTAVCVECGEPCPE